MQNAGESWLPDSRADVANWSRYGAQMRYEITEAVL